jgi:putative phage-type endonuclease
MRKAYPSNYIFCDQNSPEWLTLRTGMVTASHVADVVAKLKSGKPSAARESYKLQLLAEVVTGRATEHYVSAAMDFGKENEPLARSMYEIEKSVEVERVGYVRHASIARSGCSPDGLVGDDGLVEFKVPNTTTHLEYLLGGIPPDEYLAQMTWQMACTGREWCDFVSYDPRLPSDFGLFIVRLERNEAVICEMEKEVEKFIAELNAMSERLLAHVRPEPVGVRGSPPPRAVIPCEL